MSRLTRVLPLGVALMFVACTESLDPLEPHQDFQLGRVSGEGVLDLRPLPHHFSAFRFGKERLLSVVAQSAADAPVLETYELSFWAVRGEEKTVEVEYVDDDGKTEGRFLLFHVPALGLSGWPDGSLVAQGDSVEITLSIDPSSFHVEFAPSGLVFDELSPAEIEMWYSDDLGEDGGLTFWRRQETAEPWYPLWSEHDEGAKRLKTLLFHFSGYAVAWKS
jgi:hypothetical protein